MSVGRGLVFNASLGPGSDARMPTWHPLYNLTLTQANLINRPKSPKGMFAGTYCPLPPSDLEDNVDTRALRSAYQTGKQVRFRNTERPPSPPRTRPKVNTLRSRSQIIPRVPGQRYPSRINAGAIVKRDIMSAPRPRYRELGTSPREKPRKSEKHQVVTPGRGDSGQWFNPDDAPAMDTSSSGNINFERDFAQWFSPDD
ncbi:hypothetical protein H0H87_009897, partial [Tephrocybe sp. NHM501043]